MPDQGGKIWDVGAAGVVVQKHKALLVRKTYGHAKGVWALPGGFADHEELLDETAAREVFEETGVEAVAEAVIGVRTRYLDEGGAVFVIFRMRPVAGEPRPDGVEVDAARYFTVEEITALAPDAIFELSRNAALAALTGGEGLVEMDCCQPGLMHYRAFLVKSRPA